MVSGKLLGVVGKGDGFVGVVGVVGDVGDVGVVGELIRQTRLAEMHEPPHGIPFLQVRCARATAGQSRKATSRTV